MLREVEARGRTVEEATAAALSRVGLPAESVRVEVVDPGSRGFLGIGSREAVVRARPDLSPGQLVETILTSLLVAGGYSVTVAVNDEAGIVQAEVSGEDLGELIGRRGRTLEALQYLLNVVCARSLGGPSQVVLDIGGYRGRREEAVRRTALRGAETVRRRGGSVSLEPMSASERRLVHLTLQDDSTVATQSEGTEPFRRVVISLRGQGRT